MALCPMDVQLNMNTAECGICYEAYREAGGERVPKLLWCYHSLCLACLRKLVCQNGAFSFVVCPFCRTVTAVPPEGLQALRDDEALLQGAVSWRSAGTGPAEAPGNKGSSRVSSWSLDMGLNYRPAGPSIFTVSSMIPAYPVRLHSEMGIWGMFHVEEVPSAVLVELPSRAAPQASQAPTSVENLRLCFAVTIILLIISVFFALVFIK